MTAQRFTQGNTVEWTSPNQRAPKLGTICAVVPAGQDPREVFRLLVGFAPGLISAISDGQPRDHESYLVSVPGGLWFRVHWPRVSSLALAGTSRSKP